MLVNHGLFLEGFCRIYAHVSLSTFQDICIKFTFHLAEYYDYIDQLPFQKLFQQKMHDKVKIIQTILEEKIMQ